MLNNPLLSSNSQSNLNVLRRTLQKYLKNQDQIPSKQSYLTLCEHLCDLKILRPEQVKRLAQHHIQIAFPLTVRQFQLIIMNKFADQNSLKLLKDLKQMQNSLRDGKGVLSVWKEKGLTESEAKQLQTIFAKGNEKMREVCQHLSQSKDIIDSISQQQTQIVSAMEEWVEMQGVKRQFKDYKDFKQHNRKAIQKLFNQTKVKEVHFRKSIKTQSKDQQEQTLKIINVIGFNSNNDQQIQVTKIPKKSVDFSEIDITLATFNAYYSLTLSYFFPRFLGYNTNCDPTYYFYFREYFDGKNLAEVINSSGVILQQQTPLFQYWASNIFKALRDIHLMCDYQVLMPIKLSDISVDLTGTKIKLVNVKFSQQRCLNQKNQDNYQCQLLCNLGKLLIDILRIKQSEIQQKVKITQNKCLINALLHSITMNNHLKNGRINQRINFFNAQTHPLFDIQKIDLQIIIKNYEVLCRYK